jgi:hypothetical protein
MEDLSWVGHQSSTTKATTAVGIYDYKAIMIDTGNSRSL